MRGSQPDRVLLAPASQTSAHRTAGHRSRWLTLWVCRSLAPWLGPVVQLQVDPALCPNHSCTLRVLGGELVSSSRGRGVGLSDDSVRQLMTSAFHRSPAPTALTSILWPR